MKKIIFIISFSIITFSCNDWLHVKSDFKVEAEDFLTSENGFKSALIGLYLSLKSNDLYGENLTMNFIEYLSSSWVPKNDYGRYVMNFYYSEKDIEKKINNIFLKLYNVIAEANQILDVIDDKKDVFDSEELYKLIKGEALGIRAYCHFDILRLFGPIPQEVTGENILPYVTTISKEPNSYIPFAKFIEYLIKDISDAENLLYEIDPIRDFSLSNQYYFAGSSRLDQFFAYRQTRMNYNCLCGLKARVYLWTNDKDNALLYARKVIDATFGEDEDQTYSLGSTYNFESKNNLTLYSEHIFALEAYDLGSTSTERFLNTGSANLQSNESTMLVLYDKEDVRYEFGWGNIYAKTETGNPPLIFTLLKYLQDYNDFSSVSRTKIPLMRLSEMYLIAIECDDPEAEDLYEKFLNCRYISNTGTLPISQQMFKYEYNREFIGEGQVFYMYKRFNSPEMILKGEINENLKDVYVLPLPKDEIY